MTNSKEVYLTVLGSEKCDGLVVFREHALISTIKAAQVEAHRSYKNPRAVARSAAHVFAAFGLFLAYAVGVRIHWKTRQPILAHLVARMLVALGDHE